MNSPNILDPVELSRLGSLELIARIAVEGFLRGMHRSACKGSSIEFAEYRPYAAGDPVTHIDWRAYGKTDRLYLKDYEDETHLRVTLLLDRSASMDFQSDGVTKLRYSICLAAALSLLITRQNDAAGLMAFSDSLDSSVPPKTGIRHCNGLWSALDRIRPGGGTGLESTLKKAAEAVSRRGLIILLSDCLAPAEEILHGLSRFRHRKSEVLLLHVMDPAELELPFNDWTEFRDPENASRSIKLEARWLRDKYRRNLEDHLRRLRDSCRGAQIDYQFIVTRTPFDVALAKYLASRRLHGK